MASEVMSCQSNAAGHERLPSCYTWCFRRPIKGCVLLRPERERLVHATLPNAFLEIRYTEQIVPSVV